MVELGDNGDKSLLLSTTPGHHRVRAEEVCLEVNRLSRPTGGSRCQYGRSGMHSGQNTRVTSNVSHRMMPRSAYGLDFRPFLSVHGFSTVFSFSLFSPVG